MKIYFYIGQAQALYYYDPKIKGNIYLDKSVLYQLMEWQWLDEKILDQLEFIISSTSNAHCLYQWKISSPIPITHAPKTVAHFCLEIIGQITPEGNNYICTY